MSELDRKLFEMLTDALMEETDEEVYQFVMPELRRVGYYSAILVCGWVVWDEEESGSDDLSVEWQSILENLYLIRGAMGALISAAKKVGDDLNRWRAHPATHYPPGMGEESRRLHREYNRLLIEQKTGAVVDVRIRALTDECGRKGIVLVPGGENL